MKSKQLSLPFGPIHNKHLFSSHWLEHRLSLETDWEEHRQMAEQLLGRLGLIWKQQRNRVEQYTEPSLEQAFIQPVLSELGWTLFYQTFLRGRKPDYALFLDEGGLDRALSAGRKTLSFWNHATLVADAKSWTVNLDRPIEINKQREYPPEQIEWYIQRSNRQYGILTNGKLWRLYPHDLSAYQPRFDTYLECNLAELLERWVEAGGDGGQRTFAEDAHLIEDFLKFYLFFSPIAFSAIEDRKPLIERAAHGSNEYRLGIGEGLKDRVFEALPICIKGFLSHKPNGLDPEKDLVICKEQSLILLYRLLFVMYGEDRGLLPYRTNRMYRKNRSLSRLRDQIAEQIDKTIEGIGQDFPLNSQNLFEDLNFLFDLIDRGGKRYGVPAYNGGLFDSQENLFLSEKVLTDCYLARTIDCLSRALDPEHTDAGLFRVDYRDLSIQHLGHIYESLLELQPHFAKEEMVVVQKKGRQRIEEKVLSCSEKLPKGFKKTQIHYQPGEVFLTTDKGERRATGSYYTPNHIVDYIVMQTLGPICQEFNKKLVREIKETESQLKRSRGRNRQLLKEKLEILRNDFDDRILRLRILDPAMGSGHFLLRACQYLAEEIATNPNTGDSIADQLKEDESVLTFWKRRIVEHCLYGVDINPLAVELAKVALWLETAAIDQPLTFLDHHLRHGNSLVGGKIENLGTLPIEKPLPLFEQQVSSRLPILLDGLRQISEKGSNTRDEVKEKAKIYYDVVDKVRRPFISVADLWCATFFMDDSNQITPEQYEKALQTIGTQKKHQRLTREKWFQRALETAHDADVRAFHWELEFPEVFFDLSGRRPEAGFDVVIGNPPYGLLNKRQNKRQGVTVTKEQLQYYKNEMEYKPALGGMLNIFRLFIVKGICLLKENGVFSEIFPLAFTGDKSIAGLRKYILNNFKIISIDAFPERDDPNKRVFEDAKMSVCILHLVKVKKNRSTFFLRINKGKFIDNLSQVSHIDNETIKLLDKDNYVIPLVSQRDINILTKIYLGSKRLADIAHCYTGEVDMTFGEPYFSDDPDKAVLLKGAIIDRYTINKEMSQGEIVYLDSVRFLADNSGKKLEHYKLQRIAMQGITGVNEKIRLKMTLIKESFCANSVNYLIFKEKRLVDITFVLGLLNSQLMNYIFRKFSTNSNVNGYEVDNLPIPKKIPESVQRQVKIIVDKILAAKKENPETDTKNLENQIDQMVYKLYGLTPEEIDIVEGHVKAN